MAVADFASGRVAAARAQFEPRLSDYSDERIPVARETTVVVRSDLSGQIVPEDQAVVISIEFSDRRRNRVEIDAAEHEVAEWLAKGREIKRRGRKPGSRNRPKDAEA